MNTIYKYPRNVEGSQWVQLHRGSRLLCAQTQRDQPYLWAIVDTGEPLVSRRIVMRGTGHQLEGDEGMYLGTIQMLEGSLVLHVFEGAV